MTLSLTCWVTESLTHLLILTLRNNPRNLWLFRQFISEKETWPDQKNTYIPTCQPTYPCTSTAVFDTIENMTRQKFWQTLSTWLFINLSLPPEVGATSHSSVSLLLFMLYCWTTTTTEKGTIFRCPDSWIGLHVCWLVPWSIRSSTTLKSDPKELWPLRHLIRVIRRHELTQKGLPTRVGHVEVFGDALS